MTPYLELSEENRNLLEKLRLQDIDRLVEHYQMLENFELALLILLGLFLSGYLLYLGVRALKKRYKPTAESVIKRKLQTVDQMKEQPKFLKESEHLIRMILRERLKHDERGLTDLELYAFFRGTPLEKESEQALSLIDQGRFGQIDLKESEKERIRKFLHSLYASSN